MSPEYPGLGSWLRIGCAFVSLGLGEFPERGAQVSGAQGKSQVGWGGAAPGGVAVSVLPAAGAHWELGIAQLPGQNGCGIWGT